MAIPALLSKKANAPVMMRITREDEHYIGRARPALHSRAKVGFDKEGRITARRHVRRRRQRSVRSGRRRPVGRRHRSRSPISRRRCGGAASPCSPTRRRAARSARPAACRASRSWSRFSPKAARKLGIDQVAIHQINAPEGKAKFGARQRARQRQYATSAFVKEALDKGAEMFNWEEKKARSGKRIGTKVRGAGVAISTYSAGSIGFDGLLVIRPDGRVQFQSGIGNLGTHAIMRRASRRRRTDRRAVGAVRRHLGQHEQEPAVDLRVGRQPDDACDDARGARRRHRRDEDDPGDRRQGASAARPAATTSPTASVVGGPAARMTLAQVGAEGDRARRQVRRSRAAGGYQRLDQDLGDEPGRAGTDGRRARQLSRATASRSPIVAGFAEVEVDVETGKFHILEYAAVADVGTVINPRSLRGQTFGGSMLGIGHAISQKWVYDQHYGVPLAKRFHYSKPPTILDAPPAFKWAALEHPRSGNAGRRARHRRAAGRRRLRRGAERDRRCGRRRGLPAHAGDGRHDSDGARSRARRHTNR